MGASIKTTFRAHFDGRVIVPDEPVDLPIGRTLALELTLEAAPQATVPTPMERSAALQELFARPVLGEPIPDEALRRENMYEDR